MAVCSGKISRENYEQAVKSAVHPVSYTHLDVYKRQTRGGAALSVLSVTGKPIKFQGTGEKLDDLDVFHPDRMASRLSLIHI